MASKKEKYGSFYDWDDEVNTATVSFNVPVGKTVKDLKIDISPTSFKATVVGQSRSIVEGSLYDRVNKDESTWYLDNYSVVVTLEKTKPKRWPILFKSLRTESADSIDGQSQYEIANAYELGTIMDRSLEKAFQYYVEAAHKGSLAAQEKVSQLYLGEEKSFADIVKADAKKAEEFLKMASEQWDHPRSQLTLGNLYYKGAPEITKDFQEAEKWYLKAANKNDERAMHNLGMLYHEQQKYEESLEWWKKSAELDCPEALCQLGLLHLHGHPTNSLPIDPRIAQKYFKKAVQLNPVLKSKVPTDEEMEGFFLRASREETLRREEERRKKELEANLRARRKKRSGSSFVTYGILALSGLVAAFVFHKVMSR